MGVGIWIDGTESQALRGCQENCGISGVGLGSCIFSKIEASAMTKAMKFVVAGLLAMAAASGLAQSAPAGAPAGATGICKDGSYSTAASKSGACAGHKGVQTWYATAAPAAPVTAGAAAAPSGSAATPTAAPAAAPAAKAGSSAAAKAGPAAVAAAKTPAPGGGPGLVWVNTTSNVYHCVGTTYYGRTKAGKYMPEADAKAAGARPNGGKACPN